MLSEKYCSDCGAKLAPDTNFCPNCGAVIRKTVEAKPRRSGLVTAGGILVIIAACISVSSGVIALIGSIISLAGRYTPSLMIGYYQTLMVVGFFALIGFAFGLAGGIQSLRRKQFAFVMVSVSLLMLAGILHFLVIGMPYGSGLIWTLLFGLPIMILSLLGLVFVATKKQEFT